MNPTFSILHATWHRPAKAVAAMRLWHDRCTDRENVEYIFCVTLNDRTFPDLMYRIVGERVAFRVHVMECEKPGSAPAWNLAASKATGHVLIQAQDDVEPPQNWDRSLRERLTEYDEAETRGPYLIDLPTVVMVSDGFRRDGLLCTAICNRARYKQQGEFLHPGYLSVFSDDDFSIRAYADAAKGKCNLVDARDLVFLHRHCYHDKSVPEDETYRHENSPEAYQLGAQLFAERNAQFITEGFRTWT
jgi:hypothetical protein